MSAISSQTTLYRIEPEKNMRRFYATDVQPNLFGGFSVIRNWGRIGTRGQLQIAFYDHEDDAFDALSNFVHSKRKRGYRA